MTNHKTEPSGPETDETYERDDAVIGLMFRRSLILIVLVAIAGAGVWFAFLNVKHVPKAETKIEIEKPKVREIPKREVPQLPFKDITQEAGIDFVHFSGAEGEKLLPETMGSGCAFFDYDNDGDQDLFFVNSTAWPWGKSPPAKAPTQALYANDGKGHFENVTEAVGLNHSFYGMGVACGDYDGDGWVDLYVTAVGKNHLFHNENGKFVEVSDASGTAGSESEWSTSAAWFDLDRDGDLDLIVGNYVRWSREIDSAQDFRLVGVGRAYGPPVAFEGTYPYLFKNEGGGKFTDVSKAAGIHAQNVTGKPLAKTMGIVVADLNGDQWEDVILANDTVQNLIFLNNRNGSFSEIGVNSGIAFDSAGNARGAMGIDIAYFRNDDSIGVTIGNFANEMTALYVSPSLPDLMFTDEAIASGLGPPTRKELTFGVLFLDVDLDGRQDIIAANGHLEEDINKVQSSQQHAQPPNMLWNAGPSQTSEFVSVTADKCGEDFLKPMVARGSAYADIDSDGDLDLVLAACGGPARLLRNEHPKGAHWLRIKLEGCGANKQALGSLIDLQVGHPHYRRIVSPTHGYCSQSEVIATFGLGDASKVDKLTIRWPNGQSTLHEVPAVDQLITIQQPEESAAKAP